MVKNTLKIMLLIFIAWLWLPTGPSDFIIVVWLIDTLGLAMYTLISALLIVILYNVIEGKTIKDKFNTITKEIKHLFK